MQQNLHNDNDRDELNDDDLNNDDDSNDGSNGDSNDNSDDNNDNTNFNDDYDHDDIYDTNGLEENVGVWGPSYMNKSGLVFPSDMNTTNSYETHHHSTGELDDFYNAEQSHSQPVFNNMDTLGMCLYY